MMVTSKGILKYLIYLFIAAWMFLLGIVVGRGTSPVTFDTQKFQDRLEDIVQKHSITEKDPSERVNIEFYGKLNHPIPTAGSPSSKPTGEILPGKESETSKGETRTRDKTSLKKSTLQKQVSKESSQSQKRVAVKPKPDPVQPVLTKKTIENPKPPASDKIEKAVEGKDTGTGAYTIQIAAFKAFKDAVSQMAKLEKKGFSSYRVKSVVNGVTWYRVRTGSFSTYAKAKAFNEKLKKARINALIVKSDK